MPVKISAMPPYVGDLTGVYLPIIVPVEDDNPWVNYRMLASDFAGEDGEVMRFGFSGEDDTAAEDRAFTMPDTFSFALYNGDSTFAAPVRYMFMTSAATSIGSATDANNRTDINAYADFAEMAVQVAGIQVSQVLVSDTQISINNTSGNVLVPNLTELATLNVLYYDTSTGALTYGPVADIGGGAAMRFAVSGEDDTQGETRVFDMTAGDYQIELVGDSGNNSHLLKIGSGTRGLQAEGSLVGIIGKSETIPLWGVNTDVGDTLKNVLVLQSIPDSGVGGGGLGAAIQFDSKNSAGATLMIGRIGYTLSDATAGAVDTTFNLYNVDNNAVGRSLAVESTGQLFLDNYGSGTFTGTATKFLAVTSGGAVIEEDAPGGSSSTRFGFATEDDTAGEDRTFALSTNTFTLNTGTTDEALIFERELFSITSIKAADSSHRVSLVLDSNTGFGPDELTGTVGDSGLISFYAGDPTFVNNVSFVFVSVTNAQIGSCAGGAERTYLQADETILSLQVVDASSVTTSSIQLEGTGISISGAGGVQMFTGTLSMTEQFTPANSTDAAKPFNTICFDDSFLWYRTSGGTWKKIALTAF